MSRHSATVRHECNFDARNWTKVNRSLSVLYMSFISRLQKRSRIVVVLQCRFLVVDADAPHFDPACGLHKIAGLTSVFRELDDLAGRSLYLDSVICHFVSSSLILVSSHLSLHRYTYNNPPAGLSQSLSLLALLLQITLQCTIIWV